ncbi:MAG: bifunctional pantoate--beta-alanine ligase/(d)CMP kinase [Leptolyngbyaceae cyanobacterium MO_188.B28]|nr:bifunctional pantoate--beta-alanine ligase/(d)CMP kinase [Leptolyngbyaceae cyanobacterium MO_188.B28]
MLLLKTVEGLRCYIKQLRFSQQRSDPSPTAAAIELGLVPTMGALHAGHLSLIQRARKENDQVIVSIFVNPTQFGPGEDLANYPRDLNQDQRLCAEAGVDVIFAPDIATLYGGPTPDPLALTQVIPPPAFTTGLCGRSRPGHFQGVATVVAKLLSLVQPERAYFGQKDAQQLAIIRKLATDLNLPVEIVPCPIVREADGLALSSRNQYLTPLERQDAATLYRGLQAAEQAFQAGERSSEVLVDRVKAELAKVDAIRPDYVELVYPHTLNRLEQVESMGLLAAAAYLGKTRLIDNVVLRSRQPIIAIDGPAGAGKSTVARRVAQTLGLLYLDSGAMYRAVTWLVLNIGIDPQDQVAVAELLPNCQIRLAAAPPGATKSPALSQVWVNDQEVTEAIRGREVTARVSEIAAQPAVRQALLKQQQDYGLKGGVVMEGRDIGTQVFPEAELKVFLTASIEERARRRYQDLKAQPPSGMSLADLEQAIHQRDQQDSNRRLAPLRKASDAIEILTDGLSIDQVVDKIVSLYQQRLEYR